MTAGVTTPNLTPSALLDAVVGNRGGNTVVALIPALAQQLVASGAIAAALDAISSRIGDVELEGQIFETREDGVAATSNGEQFRVRSTDPQVAFRVYQRGDGSLSTLIAEVPSVAYLADLSARALPTVEKPASPVPVIDATGYAADLVLGGYKSSFGLADCDALVLWGDSHTEGGPVLQSKAWPIILGSLTPYRVRNRGISGFRTSHVYERLQAPRVPIVEGVSWRYNDANNFSPSQFHVLILGQNEGDLTAYRQNLRHVVELLTARGAHVVLMTQPTTSGSAVATAQHQIAHVLAREFGLEVIEGYSRRPELQMAAGPFSDGSHVATRTGVIYWSILADWLRRAPGPRRSIKVYSARNPAATFASLVYARGADDYDIARRWREIDSEHGGLIAPERFEEYSRTTQSSNNSRHQRDQYELLQSPLGVTLGDHVLVRALVPATAAALEGAAIEVQSNATKAYVLDRMANSVVNSDQTPGEWREVPYAGGFVRLDKQRLLQSMHGPEIAVMLHRSGGVTLGAPRVHYSATLEGLPPRPVRRFLRRGLIREAATASRAAFVVTGAPAEVVPFDLQYGAPRQPGSAAAIAGVLEVTAAATIGGSEPVAANQSGTYRITVWARYWPKPFLDPALYPAAAAAPDQVIDRTAAGVAFETHSPIRPETCDLRRLRMTAEVAPASGAPNANQQQEATVGVYWMPTEFIVDAPPGGLPGFLNWRLSSPEGAIQVGKITIEEVEAYVTRT